MRCARLTIMAGQCILQGFGACRGPITGEHYLQRALLEAMNPTGNTARVVGLHWQKDPLTLESFGINALTANILCKGHNEDASTLDSEFVRFYMACRDVDKDPDSLEETTYFDGPLLERAFLKNALMVDHARRPEAPVASWWKSAVARGTILPPGAGLYIGHLPGANVHSADYALEARHGPGAKLEWMAHYVAGFELFVSLGAAEKVEPAVFRGCGWRVRLRDGRTRVIRLRWATGSMEVMLTAKRQTTKNGPSFTTNLKGYNEQK